MTSTNIANGTVFDTPYETGCVALESPDSDGNFAATDSDGVVCTFTTAQVIGHADYRAPGTRKARRHNARIDRDDAARYNLPD